MKTYFFLIILIIGLQSYTTISSYANESENIVRDKSKKNDVSIIYSPTILPYPLSNPFSVYDKRTQEEILNKTPFKKITILGEVANPGVFIINNQVNNKFLIDHQTTKLVSAAVYAKGKIKIFTNKNKELIIDKDSFAKFSSGLPEDGSVYFFYND